MHIYDSIQSSSKPDERLGISEEGEGLLAGPVSHGYPRIRLRLGKTGGGAGCEHEAPAIERPRGSRGDPEVG